MQFTGAPNARQRTTTVLPDHEKTASKLNCVSPVKHPTYPDLLNTCPPGYIISGQAST